MGKLSGPVITAGSVIVLLIPWFWALVRGYPIGLAFGHPVRVWSMWILAMLRELLLMAAWFAVLVLMALPKHKDFRNMFTTPPYTAWNFAIICTIVEM